MKAAGAFAFVRRASRKPPAYLARRLTEELRREIDQGLLLAAAAGVGPLAPGRTLGGSREAAFESTATAVSDLAPFEKAVAVARGDDRWRREATRRLQRALRREVELFGEHAVPAGIPPRWLTDVHSGHSWPVRSHRRIDYVNRGRSSDVKRPWELSRMRHLVALAQAASVLDSREAVAAIEADLEDWQRTNPVGRSVNWTCAMEVALRAVNLICVDGLLLASRQPWARTPLVESLYVHGWFLARNLEVSDVNGNHFLADAVGLIWLGRYFTGVGESRRWLERGIHMVRVAASEQVLPDGLDHEGSLPYHLLVLELFLLARHAAGGVLAPIDGTLREMCDAAAVFVDSGGSVPLIGDDDGGRVSAFSDCPALDSRRVLTLGAALVDGPVPPSELEPWHLADVLWLRGPEALDRMASSPRHVQKPGPHVLREGGVVVLGSGDDHVVLDSGPIGFRGRGGHGHADAMSFVATLGGHLAVRDSGTATYTGDPALRDRLRSVSAHSSIELDSLPYTTLGGPTRLWAMQGDSPPRVLETRCAPDGAQVVQIEQSLPSRAGPALWRRKLVIRPAILTVEDRVEGEPGTAVRWSLQLPEGVCPASAGMASAAHSYRLDPASAAVLELEEVEWSPCYGALGNAPRALVDRVLEEGPMTISCTIEAL